jgi:membrane protein
MGQGATFATRRNLRNSRSHSRFTWSATATLRAGCRLGLHVHDWPENSLYRELKYRNIHLDAIDHANLFHTPSAMVRKHSRFSVVLTLFKNTFNEWLEDKAPQLGAALAYYTVFSLAPLVLLLLAVVGVIFRNDPATASSKITQQMGYFLDRSAVEVVQQIAQQAAQPTKSILASAIGIALALFGASGVFAQLQDALNTIWGLKAKPGAGIWGFIRARFLSFGMVAGVCFLLLVSLTVESVLQAFFHDLQGMFPGGGFVALTGYFVFDFVIVATLFAMIFRFLPDAKIRWRDVWIGAALTAIFFLIGKWALGLYLGSGAAGSAYGAASSLITLLLWVYYSAQILLFGAEFTQVYTNQFGSRIEPAEYAVRVEYKEIERPRP